MGIDINDLPEHIKKQIKEGDSKPETSVQAKAVPHDSRMNKIETNYSEHLQQLVLTGKIFMWKHEPFNIRLADRTFYKPDFIVVKNNGFMEIHEVKGVWRDDALVKIKTAAESHPYFLFKAVFNERGMWKYRYFNTQKNGFVYPSHETESV